MRKADGWLHKFSASNCGTEAWKRTSLAICMSSEPDLRFYNHHDSRIWKSFQYSVNHLPCQMFPIAHYPHQGSAVYEVWKQSLLSNRIVPQQMMTTCYEIHCQTFTRSTSVWHVWDTRYMTRTDRSENTCSSELTLHRCEILSDDGKSSLPVRTFHWRPSLVPFPDYQRERGLAVLLYHFLDGFCSLSQER